MKMRQPKLVRKKKSFRSTRLISFNNMVSTWLTSPSSSRRVWLRSSPFSCGKLTSLLLIFFLTITTFHLVTARRRKCSTSRASQRPRLTSVTRSLRRSSAKASKQAWQSSKSASTLSASRQALLSSTLCFRAASRVCQSRRRLESSGLARPSLAILSASLLR